MQRKHKLFFLSAGIIIAAVVAVGSVYSDPIHEALFPKKTSKLTAKKDSSVVELSETQLQSIKLEPVVNHEFALQREAVGNIDFDEDMSVQVFTPYQGKITTAYAKIGDEVEKGQPLFAIDSSDLIQSESSLIAAAGVLNLTTKVLSRDKQIYNLKGLAQKDLDQAVSDQQTAEGALKAARDAVRIFGKTDAEIDAIIEKRQIDPSLVVHSPLAGRITARNAAPGLLVQPGTPPAPYAVADISTMWMAANVAESDSPLLSTGQDVKVKVMAYPDRIFEGKISTIGAAVDPNTHRVLIRAEIPDPQHELRSGMFATFTIRTGDPVTSAALPLGGVVREGDGTMTVWVTADRRKFEKRVVKVGLQQDGYDQILEGLNPDELVATDGALFIDNAAMIDSQ